MNIFYFLVIFGLCWGPYLNVGIGFVGDVQVLFSTVVIATSGGLPWRTASREVKWVVSATLLLAIYATLLSLGYEKLIYVPSLRIVRAAIIFYASWCLVCRIYKHNGDQADRVLVTGIYFGIAAHGALMFAQFASPALREAITRWTFASEGEEINLRTRMPGLTTGGGAQLSAYMSMGFILFPYCYAVAKGKMMRASLSVGLAVVAISVVLSGRTGVYTALFVFPIMILLVGYYSRAAGGLLEFAFRLARSVFAVLACGISVYFLDYALRMSTFGGEYNNYAFERNLDMLLNPEEGIIRNSTILELKENHLFVPSDVRTFFFGDLINMDHSQGSQGAVERKLASDIGYVRLLFGYGIFGSLAHYIIYIYMIAKLWGVRRSNFMMSEMAICVFCMILIFNAKEVFVFTRIGWSICALLFCGAIISANARMIQNKRIGGFFNKNKGAVRMQFRESVSPVRR
jgi:hypothetical protein